MNTITLDDNSRPVQFCTDLGFGKNYTVAGNMEIEGMKIVRFVAYEGDATIRKAEENSSIVYLPEGVLQYFYVGEGEDVVLISGKVNVMF